MGKFHLEDRAGLEAIINMSLFNRAIAVYREEGIFKLLKDSLRYLQARYYQLRGKHTFSIGNMKTAIFITHYVDEWELRYVYFTERSIWNGILRELKPNDVFWDVGASLGFYSLLAANCSGVRVVAFEPHPNTVVRLGKNIELNQKSNIKVLNIALSDKEGRTRFDPIELGSARGKAHLTSDETIGEIEVEISSGDKLIENGTAPKPDVVKIDVEGAEHLVIKGMRSSLSRCRAVFCEVHPIIDRYGSTAADFEKSLKDMGFSLDKMQEREDGTYHIKASRAASESLLAKNQPR
jgi:FkbM family methyltransferase